MTQQALADRLYVTRQTISRWESGTRYPDLSTAKKLADILEIPLDDLLSGEDLEKIRKRMKRQKRKNQLLILLIACGVFPEFLRKS
ncbi:MAG: helix-turn-helix domain-containing protein [Lachnospiraceae bacterium]|nr:helix-turn-helix domain-containing protein [Lachnospiraceae bacterium]